MHQFSKVLVSRQQQSAFTVRQVAHGLIEHLWFHFGNVPYMVTVLPKTANNLPIYALVRYKVHVAASSVELTT